MRGAASLGYLLARTSDTLADSAQASVDLRLQCLESFNCAVAGNAEAPRWPGAILQTIPDPRERILLESSAEVFRGLQALPAAEAQLVREVLEIIVSGQSLDLLRFATASPQAPVALRDDSELDDYAWRVAGCVGAFWTQLGFLTLGDRYSTATPQDLLAQGIAYGKGLQLVNILRDLAADLAMGRCYLPVADPQNREALVACDARWLLRTDAWLAQGESYAATLATRRLRAATRLPALIARATLEPLSGASWQGLQTPTKVPRSMVYRLLLRAFFTARVGSLPG